jgi:3-methyl-2-oxobutanoate hydroxymethyltransferase
MKITTADLIRKKRAGEKIVMLTCYDFPTAMLEDTAGVDIQLVGDSVGTNVLGYADVTEVTVDDMLHHVRAVARGAKRSFVLGDLPYRSFETPEAAAKTARLFAENGADGVKMEGEEDAIEKVKTVTDAGVPVCAHIGYTPQKLGKAAIQGKDAARAAQLIDIASRLEQAGASILVLELIPNELSAIITRTVSIPTIGIGAGRSCDGQVQVVHDIAGMTPAIFRHAHVFHDVKSAMKLAIDSYVSATRNGLFPADANMVHLSETVQNEIVESLGRKTGRP